MSNKSAVKKVLTMGVKDVDFALDHVRKLDNGIIEITPASEYEKEFAWKVLQAVKRIVEKELQ